MMYNTVYSNIQKENSEYSSTVQVYCTCSILKSTIVVQRLFTRALLKILQYCAAQYSRGKGDISIFKIYFLYCIVRTVLVLVLVQCALELD
jgi:hypothetical protein